ncbi:hypothetical protein G6514_008143 [Epicoccum nigrum]|nr:hypothetical protein G6514_008143 [Epicoccum nigrum]
MRKRGKKNKRAARAKNLGDWSSMATTNGDAKAAKSFKNQNSLAAAAARESTKKTEIPSSDKKKVHSFMDLEIGPRVDKKKEAAEPAVKKPRKDNEVTYDDREEAQGEVSESDRVGMQSAVQVGSLETMHNGDGFSGATISFPSGYSWKLTQALIGVRYQQEIPPFEARQVFECARICNTHEPGTDEETAVVKVKYQVLGTVERLRELEDQRNENQNELDTIETHLKEFVEENLAYTNKLISEATLPAEIPNVHTLNEIKALEHSRNTGCVHAPQLIDSMGVQLPPGIDPQIVVGGYARFILMTKLPGSCLQWEDFWGKTEAAREEIRQAFKVALIFWTKKQKDLSGKNPSI